MRTDLVGVACGALVAAAVVLWTRGPTGRRSTPDGRARPSGRNAAAPVGDARPRWLDLVGAVRPSSRRHHREVATAAVLEVLDALGPALSAGLAPVAALRCVEPSTPDGRQLVGALLDAAQRGDLLTPVWLDKAAALASPELGLVAAAWSLCEVLGAPLASTTTTVARVLRQRLTVQRRVDVVLAGPRTTALVLTCLPLAGPGVAALLGVPLPELYGSAAAVSSVLAGAMLLGCGWWWCRRLVSSVTRARPPLSRSR